MTSLTEKVTELNKYNSLFELEIAIIKLIRQEFIELIGAYLESFDDQLSSGITDEFINREERTINFLFGTVRFKRRRYRNADGQVYFALDQKLKITKRKRFSPFFMATLAELAQMTQYRNVAKVIERVCGTSVTPDTVKTAVRDSAHLVEDQRNEQEKQSKIPEKSLKYLMLEGDGFQLKQQVNGSRVTVAHYRLYEGVICNGTRRQLINRHDFAGLDHSEVKERVMNYMRLNYDLSKLTVFIGSDAGPGYEPESLIELVTGAKQIEYVLDRYHLLKKVTTTLGMTNPLTEKAIKAIRNYDRLRLNVILDTYESTIETDKQNESYQRLIAYLNRNWKYIKHPKDRGYREVSNLGSAENSHRSFTYRMKKQGRTWSKVSMRAMLILIEQRLNGQLWRSLTGGYSKFMELDLNVSATKVTRRINLKQKHSAHVGAKQGVIRLDAPNSSSIGNLVRLFN